jgi:hypothetical protein
VSARGSVAEAVVQLGLDVVGEVGAGVVLVVVGGDAVGAGGVGAGLAAEAGGAASGGLGAAVEDGAVVDALVLEQADDAAAFGGRGDDVGLARLDGVVGGGPEEQEDEGVVVVAVADGADPVASLASR